MARALRLEFENALYHVTTRGNERRPIFRTDRDRRTFLRLLGETAGSLRLVRHDVRVDDQPLPPRHPDASAEPFAGHGVAQRHVRRLVQPRHNRCGHLFQGRFHAFLIEKETYFAEVLRYVVLHPVRAKMVERPEDYRWSSYRATAGLAPAPAWLDPARALHVFGTDTAAAQAEYRSFVTAKLGCEERLWDQVTNAIYLGTTSCPTKNEGVTPPDLPPVE